MPDQFGGRILVKTDNHINCPQSSKHLSAITRHTHGFDPKGDKRARKEALRRWGATFGNDAFAAPEPRDEFLYAARWHDRGWKDLDENPPLDMSMALQVSGCRGFGI